MQSCNACLHESDVQYTTQQSGQMGLHTCMSLTGAVLVCMPQLHMYSASLRHATRATGINSADLTGRSAAGVVRMHAAAYLRVVLLEGSNEAGHEVGAHSLAGPQADHPRAGQPEVLHGLASLPCHLHQLLAVGQYCLPCLCQQGWP